MVLGHTKFFILQRQIIWCLESGSNKMLTVKIENCCSCYLSHEILKKNYFSSTWL